MKRKVHLLPNIITAFGLSCGLFVIFKMTMAHPQEITYDTLLAPIGILILAAFADLLDGALARAMKVESDFGGFFDSLADAITFGVAPTLIILKSLKIPAGTELSFLLILSAMVYSLCGVLRLVRYSVNAQLIKGDELLSLANKKNFTGLPIPAAAAAATSAIVFLISPFMQSRLVMDPQTSTWIMIAVLLVLGYFMISRWKFLSVKALQIKVTSFRLVFITVLAAVFIFYGILHHFALTFLLLSWGYVILAWILSIIRVIGGKQISSLEDFEPDEETEDESHDELS